MLIPHLMMHQMACHHHNLQEGCPTLLVPHLSLPHSHLALVSCFILLPQVMMVLDPEREDHGVGRTSHTEVP